MSRPLLVLPLHGLEIVAAGLLYRLEAARVRA